MNSDSHSPLIRADLIFAAHDETSVEIYNRNDRSTHTVRRELLDILKLFDRPRSPVEIAEEKVNELIRTGLLRRVPSSAPSASRPRSARSDTVKREAVDTIVIPSSGRTGVIARLVNALQKSTDSGRPVDIRIYLDTEDPAAAPHLREQLGSGSSAIRLSLADRRARGEELAGLERAFALNGTERRALRFGLTGDTRFGVTTGAMRSWSLLANAGSRVLSLDDDVLPVGYSAGRSDDLQVSASDGLTIRYADSRAELLTEYRAAELDVRTAAGTYLGKRGSSSDLQPDSGARLDHERISPELWRRLEQRRARLDLVSFGYLGDSGAGATPILPSGASRAPQLLGTADEQRLALSSREVLQIVERPTVTNHPYFMSAACAFDLTATPPPFFPFGRGQDGLFALMLTQLFDDALIGHLPIALLHDPQDGRPDRHSVRPDRVRLGICRLIGILTGYYAAQISGGSRSERLIDYGEWLGEFAGRPVGTFRRGLTEIVCGALQNYASSIKQNYGHAAGTDSPLGRTVTSLLEDIDRRIATRTVTPIAEYAAAGLGEEETFEVMAGHLAEFGIFAALWPAVWNERLPEIADKSTEN